MKLLPLIPKLLPVVIAPFLILGSCRKKEKDTNPFPPTLFKNRNWHQVYYNYGPTGIDTVIGADTTAGVTYIGSGFVSLFGIKFFCPAGSSNDPIEFQQDPSMSAHSTFYSFRYYAARDSIAYQRYSSYTGAYWLLSF